MLIAIVLDRPLAEAKEPVDDPAAFTREMTRLVSVLPLLCLFCGFWLFDSCGFFVGCLGRALLALFCFYDFSGRGGRSPVEPWTRLHCSEHYWRCPVLPAVQSGAP